MDTIEKAANASRDNVMARAAEIVPILRDHAAESEEKRQLADASVNAVRDAGLFRLLLPRRWGGLEADMRTYIDVAAKVAEGCASTGWVLGVLQVHSWLTAQFPEEAQADAFADNPDALIAAVPRPRGQARKTDGGYLLSGSWPFGSGCNHADWMMLGAVIEEAKPPVAEAIFLLPIEDIEITGDWHVGGLQGTGSHSVTTDAVFVPHHRHVSLARAMTGRGPGMAKNDGALYRSAAVPTMALAVTGIAPGTADAAFRHFVDNLPGRQVPYADDLKQENWTATHLQIAEARTKIDTAHLVLQRAAESIDSHAQRGEDMALEERARIRAECSWSVRKCLDAVDTLYIAGGGRGLSNSNPVQRAQRDLHAVNMHGMMMRETNFDIYGRVLLGKDIGNAVI